jgi:peroxiredoxin family protein/TusA-related sulfurtransferase
MMQRHAEDTYVVGKDDTVSPVPSRQPQGQPCRPGECREIDARAMQCPGPIMKLNENITKAAPGDKLKIFVTDPGFLNDVRAWCNVTGNKLLDIKQDAKEIVAVVQKQEGVRLAAGGGTTATDKTIIVFDDDMDRALAAFVIANGALAMGRKVTLFFTFWGLNILKKRRHPPVKKDLISRMFGFMLPKSAQDLRLSKLNMLGIGPRMMTGIMKRKNIDTLDVLMRKAQEGGATLLACQMSMDVMGIKKEELIDGIVIGGVASYIEASESANLNLFI